MIDVAIPGFGRLALEHLVCDYNGTLARDGVLLDGVSASSDQFPVEDTYRRRLDDPASRSLNPTSQR